MDMDRTRCAGTSGHSVCLPVLTMDGRPKDEARGTAVAPPAIDRSYGTTHTPASLSAVSETEPTESESSGATRAESRTFAELLIDSEEDRTLRAVQVGMLREGDR